MAIATSAAAFIGSLGINTHIDFAAYGYQNLDMVESDINYLGVKIIRDSAEVATDAQAWLQVAQATGAKFDDYIAETSPAGMQTDLGLVPQLAQEGILASLEGGDEEDDAYPASLGNTLSITAQFQQQVYALGQQLNLPVINMSFGAGWTAANNWQGDYGAVGDLSADTGYANAHTYPNPGQLPDETIQRINGLAALAASTRPVITTEIGWNTTQFSQQTIAKYVLYAAMDGVKDGDEGMYFYGLYDDASGDWGLFNADGTPRPAATALHNLTTLLTDTNANANATSFTPGSLNYTLSGTQTGDNSVLIEKSNGQFWLSLWNETEAANAPHTITVNLGILAATVVEFDPLTGTSSIVSWNNVSTLQVSVPDHPVLLEIVPGSGGSVTPDPAPATPSGPVFTVPSGEATTTGSTIAVTGISAIDSFAASNPGTMALNVSASNGLITMTSGGGKLAGSGTHSISVNGTLAQINADLATLSYTAASHGGNDVITLDVWDQAGLEGTKSFDVAVTAAASISATPSTPSGPEITVPANDEVVAGSTAAITGVSIADLFAAGNPGSIVLNVSAGTGFVTMTDTSGAKVTGSGTHALSVTGTLAQISTDLPRLDYTAGGTAGTDSVLIDEWDQAGIEASKSIAITVTSATPPPAAQPSIRIAAADADPNIAVNGTTINAGSGNHMFFIGGTGDVLTAIGGTETVMAFQGGNTITAGVGNDTIRIAGSGNVVNAGAGTNQIDDSGGNNRIVLPQGGQGFDDIHGYVLQQNDTFDLRPMLTATAWNGNSATIGDFVKVAAPDHADAVITVDPSGIVGGASYSVATLHGSGPVSVSQFLSASLV